MNTSLSRGKHYKHLLNSSFQKFSKPMETCVCMHTRSKKWEFRHCSGSCFFHVTVYLPNREANRFTVYFSRPHLKVILLNGSNTVAFNQGRLCFLVDIWQCLIIFLALSFRVGRAAAGILWVETRDAAQDLTMHRPALPMTEDYLAPDVNSVEV